MGQEYYAVNGEDRNIIHFWNVVLDVLTAGLWDKVGIPRPLSEEDANLTARVLRNFHTLYGHLIENPPSDIKHWNWFLKHNFGVSYSMGIQQEPEDKLPFDKEQHDYILELVRFFESSGGLITDEEYFQLTHMIPAEVHGRYEAGDQDEA